MSVIFPLEEEEPQNLSQFVQVLNHIHQQMVQKEKSAIDLDTGRNHGRQAPEFQEGDVVYMFLATIKLNLSRKLQNRWIGPWTIKKKISDSLVVLFPLGNWCKNKKELACIVSRLKKIDPHLATATSVRNQKVIDFKKILQNLEPAAEDLTYQNEPEEMVETESSRQETSKKKGNEPETLPPPFPPPPMEIIGERWNMDQIQTVRKEKVKLLKMKDRREMQRWRLEKIQAMEHLKIWREKILRWKVHNMEV